LGFRHAISRPGRLSAALLIALSSVAPPAIPGAGAQNLLPPSLPPTLPGGVPLPNLPAGSQGEILQRILDAAGGRPASGGGSGSAPAWPAGPPAAGRPAYPMPGTAPAGPIPALGPAQGQAMVDPGEPLSNTEAFFAARLPEQQPPLRQFGYDTFRSAGWI